MKCWFNGHCTLLNFCGISADQLGSPVGGWYGSLAQIQRRGWILVTPGLNCSKADVSDIKNFLTARTAGQCSWTSLSCLRKFRNVLHWKFSKRGCLDICLEWFRISEFCICARGWTCMTLKVPSTSVILLISFMDLACIRLEIGKTVTA